MIKKEHIKHLKEMNTEAEKLVQSTQLFKNNACEHMRCRRQAQLELYVCFCVQKSYSMPIDLDFQKRYATTVLDLEQLNKDLNKVLHEVQQFCCEVSHL